MYENKKVGIVGIIITIIILISLVIITNINTWTFSTAENILGKLVMPIQNGITFLKNKISKNNTFFENLDTLKKQNEELEIENEKLEEQVRELEIIKSENLILRQYANMKDEYSGYKTVPAYIINRDITNLSEVFIINVGTEDGVHENMPVISNYGLVGYVISSTKNTAKVQTIIDTASSISSITSTSRDSVVTKGILNETTKLKMTYIPIEASLALDDTVETSGLGGIYPKGILIGRIKEIVDTKNITDRYAIIETAVDFSKIETVLVITNNF